MITRNRILFILGLWIVLVPFLGFPSTYKTFFTIASGLVAIVLAFLYARHKRLDQMDSESDKHESESQVYTQSEPHKLQKQQPKSVYSGYLEDNSGEGEEEEEESEVEDNFTNMDAFRSRARTVKTH